MALLGRAAKMPLARQRDDVAQLGECHLLRR
jgi:hypothetical protein